MGYVKKHLHTNNYEDYFYPDIKIKLDVFEAEICIAFKTRFEGHRRKGNWITENCDTKSVCTKYLDM